MLRGYETLKPHCRPPRPAPALFLAVHTMAMEVYKVADKVADMVVDININMEMQFGEKVGHGGWLIGPKLSRPKAYPTCVS